MQLNALACKIPLEHDRATIISRHCHKRSHSPPQWPSFQLRLSSMLLFTRRLCTHMFCFQPRCGSCSRRLGPIIEDLWALSETRHILAHTGMTDGMIPIKGALSIPGSTVHAGTSNTLAWCNGRSSACHGTRHVIVR